VTRSARLRQESRGAHYNLDHPDSSLHATSTVLRPVRQGAGLSRRAVA
jgi:aspartate oxidase